MPYTKVGVFLLLFFNEDGSSTTVFFDLVLLLNFSCPRFLTVSKFLMQMASKSCISMQLLGASFKFFLILDVSSRSLQQVLCGQSRCKIISRMEGTGRTIFLLSSFTSGSKSCLNMGRRHFEEKLQTFAIV